MPPAFSPNARRQDGFTLIELLVVILIIGILASIAIPTFLNQRGKAQDTDAKVQARSAQTAIETRYVDNQTYVSTSADLVDIEPTLGQALNLTVTSSVNSYSVSVDSKTGNTFTIKRTGPPTLSTTERTCTRVNPDGGCPISLSW